MVNPSLPNSQKPSDILSAVFAVVLKQPCVPSEKLTHWDTQSWTPQGSQWDSEWLVSSVVPYLPPLPGLSHRHTEPRRHSEPGPSLPIHGDPRHRASLSWIMRPVRKNLYEAILVTQVNDQKPKSTIGSSEAKGKTN